METVYHSARGGVERIEGGRPGEIDFYPREAGADELIDRFAIAGSAAYCAERLREIAALGIDRIYIGTRAVGVDLDERNADRIGREVLPLVRA
jgi:alkanesulfonate monooxygenase SsuD/methylene tetrahydromethanopterin reductase-like flavin-dependent oxidoreductase (luciferase family)